MPKLSQQDYVIIGAAVLGCVGAAGMYAFHFPAVLIAVSVATAVAALVYGFLGGVAETSFQFGAFKLAGSGALLIGASFWIDKRLAEEMPTTAFGITTQIADLKDQVDTLKKGVERAKSELAQSEKRRTAAEQERDAANQQLAAAQGSRKPAIEQTLAAVQAMTPGSSEAAALLAIEQRREGPWHVDPLEMKVTITGVNYLPGRSAAACAALNYGPDTLVALTSLVQLNGRYLRGPSPAKVTDWGHIDRFDCGSPTAMQIHVSCSLLVEIFTEEVVKCDKKNQPLFQNGFTNDFPATAVVLR